MTILNSVERILVVDDSTLVRKSIRKALEAQISGEIIEADGVAAAKAAISAATEPFTIALLDLVLPDGTRGEVVDLSVAAGIPSIVFTSELSPETRKSILSRGAIDYVVKKGDSAIQQIVTLIQRLIRNRTITVLTVDDSPSMREYYRKLLSNYNFVSLHADNGAEALQIFRTHPEIRLVIADYAMPDMDGFALVTELRKIKSWSELPIIGCTSQGNQTLAARFLKEGANDFMFKPFLQEEFYQRVIQNIERSEQVAHLESLNETKNRFVGMAAHDLRSPLGNIDSIAEMLQDGFLGEITAEQREMIVLIRKSTTGMLGLINRLLDVTTIESGSVHIEPVQASLRTIVNEQMAIHQGHAEKKAIEMVLQNDAELPMIDIDPSAIGQVVSNLLSNAIKYGRYDSFVTIRLFAGNGVHVLEIEDQGHGIREEDRKKLFTPFSKLGSRPTGGESSHGLGLAIVKRLVEAHHGSISVSGTDSGGTTFRVEIPA